MIARSLEDGFLLAWLWSILFESIFLNGICFLFLKCLSLLLLEDLQKPSASNKAWRWSNDINIFIEKISLLSLLHSFLFSRWLCNHERLCISNLNASTLQRHALPVFPLLIHAPPIRLLFHAPQCKPISQIISFPPNSCKDTNKVKWNRTRKGKWRRRITSKGNRPIQLS